MGFQEGGRWSQTCLAYEGREQVDDLIEGEIADASENSEQNGSDNDHDGRIAQFAAGGPGSFLKLSDHLAEEDAGAAEWVFH